MNHDVTITWKGPTDALPGYVKAAILPNWFRRALMQGFTLWLVVLVSIGIWLSAIGDWDWLNMVFALPGLLLGCELMNMAHNFWWQERMVKNADG